ncbi:hypothetical protein LSH36_20g14046 [Paralvinella palmiformis]|uniref:Uncharacterized protein n=1 Tax=Paralvinella palmiformis TaxID=53620 RepID=A0AAD9KBM6_9ANNE|nr:hypothetical protein LSH36_20g14046 [Paralvinella palmiformis]
MITAACSVLAISLFISSVVLEINSYGYDDGIRGLPPSNVTIYCLLRGGSCTTPGQCGDFATVGGFRPAVVAGQLLLCNHTTVCCVPHHHYGYRVVGYGYSARPYAKKHWKRRRQRWRSWR